MNLNQYIMNELKKKEWTFEEISNVQTTINILAHKAYDHMTPKDKLDMVWNEIGEEFQKKVLMKIKAEIAETIKIELSTATVKFGGNENDVSEGSLGGKSSATSKTDEKKDSKKQKGTD
tara:strand:+ start:1965 stop:2321 length:357 start_codon:yes stop_codon:yes gene_type:complete